jgi:hypothetical protein
MISATTSPRPPSFWMTALSLLVAGSVSALFASLWAPYLTAGAGLGVSLVYASFVGAFIGGIVLRAILPRLAGVAISYPWAVVAIGLGSFVGNAATVVAQTITARHVPVAVAPLVSANPLFVLGGAALRLLVSYRVIAFAGRDAVGRYAGVTRTRPPVDERADSVEPRPRGSDGLEADLVRTQSAVARTCIDVSRSAADDIPGRVVDALTELGTCAHLLRHATPPSPETRAAVGQLLEGLERFQNALTDIASDAAATGSHRLVQRGLLYPSLADVSDGGGLARYELDHADGLATIRDSFERLRSLGVLRED